MPNFSFLVGSFTITITGFLRDGLIRRKGGFKQYTGPTIELTVTLPHNDPAVFNVPFPVTAYILGKLIAFHGPLLRPAEVRAVLKLVDEFAMYVSHNHSWYHPYRPLPAGMQDCAVAVKSVSARCGVGKVEAGEFATSWF